MLGSLSKWCVPVGAVLLASGADAHHSRAMFDLGRQVQLTGTVREFQFTNPHCYIQLTVRNAQGRDEEWSVEMGAPNHLRGAGWKRSTLKAGDRINVTIAPLRDGRHGGELVSLTAVDGRNLGLTS